MQFFSFYASPMGKLTLAADSQGLTNLWFPGDGAPNPEPSRIQEDLPVFQETRRWLDAYFSGRDPGELPPLHLVGTDFQMAVWDILVTIAYGETITYGKIASILAARQGKSRMSAQAVGDAVGRNPIPILVPCHRVVGSTGNLPGFS